MLHSTHYIHQLLPPLKFVPMKVHTYHCAFALTYCHYNQGCICQIFTGGSEFQLAMTDRATIAGMEVAKLVLWNSLLN